MTGGPQVTDVLGLLEDVREASAPQQWIALCPAHDDRSPSLSVRLADDGRWLVHCFAGCSAGEICAPLGITLRDLFPKDGPKGHRGLHRHVLTASERLELIDHEVTAVAFIAADVIDRKAIDESTWQRLAQACERIGRARYV